MNPTSAVGYVDATLRDLAPQPWGSDLSADDLAAAAAALAPAGPAVLEALDARSARSALEARHESPWDRLRSIVREAGAVPVGVVVSGRTLWGELPLEDDLLRRFVLCAAESGAGRLRVLHPLNDVEALVALAEAAAEAGITFVPTLVVGPAPPAVDVRWTEEARALAALPGAGLICVSDGAGHLSPTALGALVREVGEATGLPVEVQVQAPGGLAPLSATAAVAAGASAVHASAGPVALVAARPSAETLRAALIGGPRHLGCEATALDRAARTVGPMLPADRLRQAAAAVFGRAVAIPPALEGGLISRLGRLGLSRNLAAVAEEAAAVARDLGAVTLAYPIGSSVVAQAAQHVIDGQRFASLEPELAHLVLGRLGRLRGQVTDQALEAARAADPGELPVRDRAAVEDEAPTGLSDEDLVLWAQLPEGAAAVIGRRRSLASEAQGERDHPPIDRELLETLVQVVEASEEAEVSVEVGGARITVRRAAPAAPVDGVATGVAGTGTGEAGDGLVRVTSPMVGTFYRAPDPESPAFVEEGQAVEAGQTLCLIEAMKLFNEIVADRAGVVRQICIANGEPAEFGQLLFLIEP